MEIKIYNTDFVNIVFNNEIIFVTFKKGPITLAIAKELVEKRLEFSKEKKYPILITDDENRISSLNRNAREFLGKGKATEGIIATAFYTNSAFNKYIINFILKISTKQFFFPTKIFSNKEEAIKWLKTFI